MDVLWSAMLAGAGTYGFQPVAVGGACSHSWPALTWRSPGSCGSCYDPVAAPHFGGGAGAATLLETWEASGSLGLFQSERRHWGVEPLDAVLQVPGAAASVLDGRAAAATDWADGKPSFVAPRSLAISSTMSRLKLKIPPLSPFFLILFLVWFIDAVEIRVPDLPVVARFGQDTALNCAFSPDSNFSLSELNVIWELTDISGLVHSFVQGKDHLEGQFPNFANRTALFYEELPRGNVSLLLRRVQIADEGSFTCFVRVKDNSRAAVSLQVAASYTKPSLYLEPNKNLKPGDAVKVTCLTFHGYPEATVLWRDALGNNITDNVTVSQVANEEGLFDVQSVLRVILEPKSTYSCLVRNTVLQEETHASVTITGQHLTFPAIALWVTVGLSICLLILLGALAYVCRRKILQICAEDEENTGTDVEEGEELKTATQPLKDSNSNSDHPQPQEIE